MTPEKSGEILTDIGLEVEGMEEIQTVKGGLEGLVIGEVLTCEKHPNADKLSLTTVNVGQEEALQIVCGAPNVAAGQKVVVATHGTTIYPIEGEPFKIKRGKIRGEVSNGMICAEDEIGLGNDHAGIMVLDENAKVGSLAKDYFEINTDIVYEIGLTPNRSDATCHIGVAEDLAAYLKINEGLTTGVDYPNLTNFHIEKTNLPFKVEVLNNEACPRYAGVSIDNITVKESPQWLKDRLNAIDVRPINNVVDITNFILHEYGQPLHAFDADKVSGKHIIVDTLPEGTKFISLDEKERSLSAEDLMICDGDKKGMCIGGIFGGIGSGVTESTTSIFLESAHFNAGWIRRSSTRHLLRTDAAKVFEKGSDPNVSVDALKRATLLIGELAGGKVASELVDIYPEPIKEKEIELHYDKLNKMVGIEIPKEEVHNILQAMKMELRPVDDSSLAVKVPTNKSDVVREADLIEEVLRIYGFNKVPIPTTVKSTIHFGSYPEKSDVIEIISNFLVANGFNEMMGLSLIEERKIPELLGINSESYVYINNTSNVHLNIMRPEPLTSGLQSVLHNYNYQQKDLKLFEIGKSYQKSDGENFVETPFLTMFVTGQNHVEHWSGNTAESDLYSIKKWTDWLLSRLGIYTYQVDELSEAKWSYGLSYRRGKENIVKFGAVNHEVLEHADIKSQVFYAEYDLATLVKFGQLSKLTVKEISKYPSVKRDLALVIDEGIAYSQIERATKKLKSNILQNISLFDIYKSEEHLGKGKKSYAISMFFQDQTNTLKDKIVDKEMSQLIEILKKEVGAEIRS